MANYIKANPLVAKYLGLENDRNTVADGNFILWQGDMLAFGKLTELYAIAQRIGAIILSPYEAKQEQDGTTLRTLPLATDEQFITDAQKEAIKEAEENENKNQNPGTDSPGADNAGASDTESSVADKTQAVTDESGSAEADSDTQTKEGGNHE